MERVLLDDVVHTDYGQFDLVWSGFGFDGDFDRFFRGQANGLVGAASGDGVYINLARRSGGSRVRIALADSEPPLPGTTSPMWWRCQSRFLQVQRFVGRHGQASRPARSAASREAPTGSESAHAAETKAVTVSSLTRSSTSTSWNCGRLRSPTMPLFELEVMTLAIGTARSAVVAEPPCPRRNDGCVRRDAATYRRRGRPRTGTWRNRSQRRSS
jgi:hypothetical protein